MQEVFSYEQIKELLGKEIIYEDYLGQKRSGVIGWVEPCKTAEVDENGRFDVWIYIADQDIEYNTKTIIVPMMNNGKREMTTVCYADIRLSSEVILDE